MSSSSLGLDEEVFVPIVDRHQMWNLIMDKHPFPAKHILNNFEGCFAHIIKALHSPMVIGHPLFWLLRAEMHNADVCDK